MRATGLLILVAATAVSVAAVTLHLREDEQASAASSDAAGALFPELLDRANEVAEVSIQSADETVTLKNQADAWVLLERGGFPAEFPKIQGAVVGLGRLAIVEPKTAKPEYHAKLGVADPGAEGSTAKRIELRDAAGETICAAIVGESNWRGGDQMVYVRRGGEDQVWLCEGRLDLNPSATSWIPREIIRLDRERVESVEIRHASGERVQVAREGEDANTFVIENLPEDRSEKSPGIANSVGSALAYLSLEDVQPVEAVDFEGDPVAQTTYRCADGLVVEAVTARHDDKIWLKLEVAYEEPVAAVGPVASAPVEEDEGTDDESEAEGDEPASPEDAEVADEGPDPGAVRAEAEELAARLDGWAFAIPQYKLDVIARTMEDLLAPLEEPGEASGASAEAPPVNLEELLGAEAAAELLQQMPGAEAAGGENPTEDAGGAEDTGAPGEGSESEAGDSEDGAR